MAKTPLQSRSRWSADLGVEPADLIVIGGGELSRVIIEAIQAGAIENVIGFLDPNPCKETETRTGVRRLGDDSHLRQWPHAKLVLAVGATEVTEVRSFIVRSFPFAKDRWYSVVHPDAMVSPTATVEPGAIILAGAVVCSGARIGRHAIVNIGVMIDHDVHVGDFVHVAPGAALGGGSSIGEGSYVGMQATVRDHVKVGPKTMIGMGAVVTKNSSGSETLLGIPAKPMSRQHEAKMVTS